MAKRSGQPLTAAFCRTVTRAGRYGDGRGGFGLSLLVKPMRNGRVSRTWSQRVIIDGKPTSIGLGAYPVTGLAEARRKALANRKAIEQGKDPRGGGIPSFEQATDRTIRLHSKGWKPGSRTESAWRNGFTRHVFPKIGRTPIDKITTADVLAVISPIWHTTPRQAELLKRRISQVMKWAQAHGYRPDNPAGEPLAAVLPRNGKTTTHHRALHHRDVADALVKVRDSGAAPSTRLAIEFVAVTASRTTEVRHATWDEMDLTGHLWTVPAERMKTGREHRVPLSARALEVVAEARQYDDGSGLVFPGQGGRPVGHGTLAATFRRLELGTVHGLRSSFRDWCSETGVTREVAEQALAHAVQGVEGAYARSDLLELRQPVLEAWGQYVA